MFDGVRVGVLFRNNEELVEPWFWFLRKSTDIPLSIIAIDQGSLDDTFNKLTKCVDPQKDFIIREPVNLGIAGGRNRILKKVKELNQGGYENLLLMDSDVFIIERKGIEKLVEGLVQFPKAGIVYGEIRNYYTFVRVCRGISFCLIRKEAFEQIGEFDENYKMFWDDTDFMDRMGKTGMLNAFTIARSVHMWGQTTNYGSESGEIRKKAMKHDIAYFEKKWNKILPKKYHEDT